MGGGSSIPEDPGSGGQAYREYLDKLTDAVGHRDRTEPLRSYLTGLLLPGDRKTLEPIAGRLDPANVSKRHQSLHHFVNEAPWSDDAILRVARQEVLALMDRVGGLLAWTVGDICQVKKGDRSVGVDRQSASPSGPSTNCQVSVQVSIANESISVPIAWQLFLPASWARPGERRQSARVPNEIRFRSKEEIALDAIDRLLEEGVPRAPMIAPTAYGRSAAFRASLSERGLSYVVGVPPSTRVIPLLPLRSSDSPRPMTGRSLWPWRRLPKRGPRSALELACLLPASAWASQSWTEGDARQRTSRFTVMPVQTAPRGAPLRLRRTRGESLLVEWPEGDGTPWNFWLTTLPDALSLDRIVRLAKLRWRVDRDHTELSQEFGLTHFEGRGWRGFHHHASLSIAAYAFWAARRVERAEQLPGPSSSGVPAT